MMCLSSLPSSLSHLHLLLPENAVVLRHHGVKAGRSSDGLTSADGWQAALGLTTPNVQTGSFYLKW